MDIAAFLQAVPHVLGAGKTRHHQGLRFEANSSQAAGALAAHIKTVHQELEGQVHDLEVASS